MSKTNKRKIMLVVGEESGDAHAARLVKYLREIGGDFEFFGATGEKMRAEGVETSVEADQFGIMGLPEVAKALPMFWRVFKKLKATAIEQKPDCVVLVDFPEFNLKLAKALKKSGLRVVYYISPQLWAWRKYRVKAIREYVDLLLTILPFEKEWYRKNGVKHVQYIGNPLAGEVKPKVSREEFCAEFELDSNLPIVSLLPGSRRKELSKILPVMLEAAVLLEQRVGKVQFILPLARNRALQEVREVQGLLKEDGEVKRLVVVQDRAYDALNASNAAAVASGTATLEAALIGTPFVMVYLTSSFNWHVFTPFISTEFFSLANLVAEKMVVKELLQNDLTPETLSNELESLLQTELNSEMKKSLNEIKIKLGSGGASKRAAESILELLRQETARFPD
ncbi:MAG: lipid-A-disaccharide synthase [Pyrinomonadaceae bacterium]